MPSEGFKCLPESGNRSVLVGAGHSVDMDGASPSEESDSFADHLLQLDHWTFLLALALVVANIAVESSYLSAAAAALLVVALGYDAWEFYAE